jgi:hypothetical protein
MTFSPARMRMVTETHSGGVVSVCRCVCGNVSCVSWRVLVCLRVCFLFLFSGSINYGDFCSTSW